MQNAKPTNSDWTEVWNEIRIATKERTFKIKLPTKEEPNKNINFDAYRLVDILLSIGSKK